MKAYDLERGMKLPHTTTTYDRPNVVQYLEYDGAYVKIKTPEGNYRFHLMADVVFPRRASGPKIWIGKMYCAEDLAVDDIIDPVNPAGLGDPRLSPHWDTTATTPDPLDDTILTQEDLMDEYVTRLLKTGNYQLVTEITFAPAGKRQGYARVQTMSVIDRVRHSYNIWVIDDLTFPREDDAPVYERKPRRITRRLESHGPYRNVTTGVAVMFAKHPFGRGRWPENVPRYSDDPADYPTHESIPVIRPPRKKDDWLAWTYEGPTAKRHPSDPVV